MTNHVRREPRYAVNIEVHVHDGSRRLVTETREVSRQGLFVFLDPAPPISAELALQIHPQDDAPIQLAGRVCYRLPDIGVGVELIGTPQEMGRYQGLIGRLAVSQEAWQVIGHHLGEAEAQVGPAGGDRVLIPVGRGLLALRLLFERAPVVSVEEALGGRAQPHEIPNRHLLLGLLAHPVELKLHERDRLRQVWLGVAQQGPTFVAVVPPQPDGAARWVIYALSGQEQLVFSVGGQACFPEFRPEDLMAIERDRLAQEPSRAPRPYYVAEPPRLPKTPTGELPAFPREHLPTPSLGHWTPYDHRLDPSLLALFDSLGAETRMYRIGQSERQVRLLRDLAFLVRKVGTETPMPGTLVHDGRRLCVIFGLRSEDEKVMRPLGEDDEIRLPTLDG